MAVPSVSRDLNPELLICEIATWAPSQPKAGCIPKVHSHEQYGGRAGARGFLAEETPGGAFMLAPHHRHPAL